MNNEVLISVSLIILIVLLFLNFLIFKKFYYTVEIKNGKIIVYGGFNKCKLKLYNGLKDKKYKGEHEESRFYKVPKPKTIKEWSLCLKDIYHSEKENVIVFLKEANKKIYFSRTDVYVAYGFGDAAVTGITNGIIWTSITAIVSLVKKYIDIKEKINVAVEPMYTEKIMKYNLTFNFRINLYSAIILLKDAKSIYDRNIDKIKNQKGGF